MTGIFLKYQVSYKSSIL